MTSEPYLATLLRVAEAADYAEHLYRKHKRSHNIPDLVNYSAAMDKLRKVIQESKKAIVKESKKAIVKESTT